MEVVQHLGRWKVVTKHGLGDANTTRQYRSRPSRAPYVLCAISTPSILRFCEIYSLRPLSAVQKITYCGCCNSKVFPHFKLIATLAMTIIETKTTSETWNDTDVSTFWWQRIHENCRPYRRSGVERIFTCKAVDTRRKTCKTQVCLNGKAFFVK